MHKNSLPIVCRSTNKFMIFCRTTILFCIGSIFFKCIGWFLGLIMYSYYSECSPLATGEIKKPDQILPYYIMQVSSTFPGLPGIFVAGLFGAALR